MSPGSHPPKEAGGPGSAEEDTTGSAASMRGRLKECARSDGALAERRGRLKQASDRVRSFARRLRERS